MVKQPQDGVIIHIVAKPINKEKFWRNVIATLITTCVGAAIGAILTVVITESHKKNQEQLMPKILLLLPIQLVHDTVTVRDTVYIQSPIPQKSGDKKIH